MNSKNTIKGLLVAGTKFPKGRFDSGGKIVLDDGGYIEVGAIGECCSDSWIEDVEEVAYYPCKIMGITSHLMSEGPCKPFGYDGRHTYLKSYAYTVITDNGYIRFNLRNASNGYYGGCLSFHRVSQDGTRTKMKGWPYVETAYETRGVK